MTADESRNRVAEAPETNRNMDAEVRVLSQILRALAKLEPPARKGIVAYLSARYIEEEPQ